MTGKYMGKFAAIMAVAAITASLGLSACGQHEAPNSNEGSSVTSNINSNETASADTSNTAYDFTSALKGIGNDGNTYYYATDKTAEHTAVVVYAEELKMGKSYIGQFVVEDGDRVSVTDEKTGDKIAFDAVSDGKGHMEYSFNGGTEVVMEECSTDEIVEVLDLLG